MEQEQIENPSLNPQQLSDLNPEDSPGIVGRYSYYCPKCGFSASDLTKPAWNTTKKFHKRNGCNLQKAPHKEGFVLARPQLAAEAATGKTIVEAAQEEGKALLDEAQMKQVQNYLGENDSPSE